MTVFISKHTLNLRAGDYLFLQNAYGEGNGGLAIRTIVAEHVDKIQENPRAMIELPNEEEMNEYNRKRRSLLAKIQRYQEELEKLG